MFRRCGAVPAIVLFGSVQASAYAAAADGCPAKGDERIAIAAVDQRLELRLADGRLLRLVGVDPSVATPGDPQLAETARAGLARLVAGRVLTARVAGKPDRWGRLAASVFLDGDGRAGGLAAAALAAGLARWRPEPDAHACRDALGAAEDQARRSSLGLWRDPYYAVLATEDAAAFAGRSASVVVAEGRVAAVDAGPRRTRIRFAARDGGGRGATVVATILPRTAKTIEAAGVKLGTLIGKTLRVRGLLDLRFGPDIEVASPDALEIPAPRPPGAG